MYYFLQGGITRSERFDTVPTQSDIDEFRQRVRLTVIRVKKQVGRQQVLLHIDELKA